MTVREVARSLKLSTTFVWRDIRAGEPPTIRLGCSVRVARTDLAAYIEARREAR
jgi:excisionase family DNA binding protein